jgi:phage FluMu protein Com
MVRRKTINKTGLARIEGIRFHEAWIGFICLSCKELNNIKIGITLLEPKTSYETCSWECSKCGYVHSKDSDLPFEHWDEDFTIAESIKAQRFWEAFFRIATENSEAYWKQCNTCGRVLPFASFSKHTSWGPLERQMECRSCKGAINAILNPKRTKQQLHESSVRRRIADLLVEGENEKIDIEDLFNRFGSMCFKTGVTLDVKNRSSYEIDHIMPSRWLYPLTKENACLLSSDANANKKGKWPSECYTNNELIELAKITGADLSLLASKTPIINTNINVNKCVERYLQVREKSHLPKRINELKKIITDYDLVDKLSKANKKLLGFK